MQTRPDNFSFIKNYDQLYSLLKEGERNIYLNHEAAIESLRKALEVFIRIVIKKIMPKDTVERDKLLGMMTGSQINILLNQDSLKRYGYTGPFTQGVFPLLTNSKLTYRDESGLNKSQDVLHYVLFIGNKCHHSENEYKSPRCNPLISYQNTNLAFEALHTVMRAFFFNYGIDALPYDKLNLPLGNTDPIAQYVPEDSRRTLCRRELFGVSENRGMKKYHLYRIYFKKNRNEDFLCRNYEAFRQAIFNNESNVDIPRGIPELHEVVSLDDSKSDFYIVSYSFLSTPQALTIETIKEMSHVEKLRFCLELIQALMELQTSQCQIFHRNLTHNCIVVTQKNGTYHPYIIKFDYAKIAKEKEQMQTVIKEFKRKRDRQELKRYFPNDNVDENTSSEDWSKFDVFSLGVLLFRILQEDIKANFVDRKKLKSKGYSDDLIDVLEMTQKNRADRCTIDFLEEFFIDECKDYLHQS